MVIKSLKGEIEMMKEIFEKVKEFVEVNGENKEMMKEFKEGLKEILKVEKGEGRKGELREILKSGERMSIKEIGERMGISDKNVSSLLSYLRKEGMKICTDSDGRKFVE